MAWDAVPEREDLFEEGVLGAPEPDHVGAGLAPAQHGAQANEQDLQKLVALGIARARILQIRENRRKLLHGTTFDPKWCHRVEPVRLNSQANFLNCDSPDSDAHLACFLLPPWQTAVSAATLSDLAFQEGATPVTDGGRALPPLTARAELAPGVLVVDIGVAQKLLDEPERVSRLLVSPDAERAAPPLSTIIGDQLRLVGPEEVSDLGQLTESFHLNLTAFGLLAFVGGLFIVHSSIGLAFEQRLPMMRTLRACGVSSRALVTALLTELIALALIAGVLGVLGGSLIASALLPDVAASLRGLYGARVAGRLTLEYDWWLAGLSMAVIGALVAAGASLLKSHRLPVLALAQRDAWREAHQRWLHRQGLIAVLPERRLWRLRAWSGPDGRFRHHRRATSGSFAMRFGIY